MNKLKKEDKNKENKHNKIKCKLILEGPLHHKVKILKLTFEDG